MQQAAVGGAASTETKVPADDPIGEAQGLLPVIKQSLGNLIKVACEALIHQTSMDDNEKLDVAAIKPGQFDRQLENFYSVCDELQVCLITALDAVVQSRESSDIYKVVDAPGPGDAQVPRTHQTFTLSYDQCLDAAEKRAAEIKELHDILQEFAHSLKTS
jgi:mediator of RNA polymerase II transcription subunit 29